MQQLSAPDLAAWLADPARAKPLLLDVREAWEVQTASLPGIVHIPMGQIPARIDELAGAGGQDSAQTGAQAGTQDIVAICHHGTRSMQVAYFLESRGIGPLHNLAGGMEAWSTGVDATVPRY